MSVTRELAAAVRSFAYTEIPEEVVQQTKRILLDTLGCALGGYGSEASRIIQEYVREARHPKEATVFGSGLKRSASTPCWPTARWVRYL